MKKLDQAFNFTAGVWAPPKIKMSFPPRRQYSEANSDPNYREYRFPLSGDEPRELGVYLREDFERNPYPPVIIITGGLGFSRGAATANGWKNYLKHWNPILIDTRGAGNSFPLGDPSATDVTKIVSDIIQIQLSLGLKEVGIIGYSFAGSLALLTADALTRNGYTVPFVAGISPTLCNGDQDWCFDYKAIGQTFGNSSAAFQRWNDLVEPLARQGKEISTQTILETYATALRTNDTDIFLDAFVRMRKWEDAPYMHLPDDYSTADVRASLLSGMKDNKNLSDFIADLTAGRADLDLYFHDPEAYVQDNLANDPTGVDRRRTDIRQARTLARYLGNIIIWTESWKNNCGQPPQGITATLIALRAQNIKGLLTLNTGDPLVPPAQFAQWQSAWPEAARILTASGHGQVDTIVKNQLFDWLEDRRMELCESSAEQRQQWKDSNRIRQLDLNDAFRESAGQCELAAAAMALSRPGNRDDLTAAIRRIRESERPPAQCLQFADNPATAKLEYQRLLPFMLRKAAYMMKNDCTL